MSQITREGQKKDKQLSQEKYRPGCLSQGDTEAWQKQRFIDRRRLPLIIWRFIRYIRIFF